MIDLTPYTDALKDPLDRFTEAVEQLDGERIELQGALSRRDEALAHARAVYTYTAAAIANAATAAGIETLIHYPTPLPEQPAFAEQDPASCPTANIVCAEVLSLPLHPRLPDRAVTTVANAVRSFPDRSPG